MRTLTRSGLARNVLIVASGTAGAQAITLAATPLLTRLYGPAAFGEFGAFTALLAVLAPLAALTYPIAIVIQPNDRAALGVVRLSLVLAAAFAVATGVVLAAARAIGVELEFGSTAGALAWLLPAALVAATAREVATQWAIRKQTFHLTAQTALAHAALVNAGKVALGLAYPLAITLVAATVVGSALHALLLWAGIRRTPKARPEGMGAPTVAPTGALTSSGPSLTALARANSDFPLFRTPQVAVNKLGQALPVLLLLAFFGPREAGFFTAVMLLLNAPVTLLGKSVEDVLYPRIAELCRQGADPRPAIARATGTLAGLGLVPLAAVVLLAPWLVPLLFGTEWADAASYARWLSVWTFFVMVGRPAFAAVPPLRLQGANLVLAIVSLVLRAGALAAGALLFASDEVAVALFAAAGIVSNVALVAMVHRLAPRGLRAT